MKNVTLAATLLASLFVTIVSVAKNSTQPAKIKEVTCADVMTSCGKRMIACGESTAEMLDCAVEAEQVACGG
jgi:hypothetical protein